MREITDDAREQYLKTCSEQQQVYTYLSSEYINSPCLWFLIGKAILNLD